MVKNEIGYESKFAPLMTKFVCMLSMRKRCVHFKFQNDTKRIHEF